MSPTTDITCEYCAVQRHECSVWRKVECHDDMTRQEVWCCNECWEGGDVLETINDEEDDSDDDDNFRCDKCNCVKDREFHVSLNGDDSGNTICEECIDDYIAERVLEARRLVQAREICNDEEEDFETDDQGVLCFKSKAKGWLYAEPYCFNCGFRARDGECVCCEDEMDWREAEYEAE